MHLSDLAKEVDELRERELIHSLLVANSVDDSHLRLSKNYAKDLIWDIKLALTRQSNAFFQTYSFLLCRHKVVESLLQNIVVLDQNLRYHLIAD